jgi:hypothetical protein
MTSEPSVLDQVRSRLAHADELMQAGKRDASTRHRAQCEQHRAWETLWAAAYLAPATPELREAFAELFPPTPDLQRQLADTLACLREGDERAALATANALERLPRRSLTMPLEREVGDPRLVFALCEVLQERRLAWHESEHGRATMRLLVQFFGSVADRMGYRTSTVVYEALDAVRTTTPPLHADIAFAMCHLADARKWEPIIEVLETATQRQAEPLATALNFAGEPPPPLVPRLTTALLACLRKSKRPQDWITAIGRCASPEAIPALERLRVRKAPSARLQAIDDAVTRPRRRSSS